MDGSFDFIKGDLGYVIQRAPGATDDMSNPYVDDNEMVLYHADNGNDLGYIIEVHYLGSAATGVMIAVSNMTGDIGVAGSQVDYVSNNINQASAASPEYTIYLDGGDSTVDLDGWSLQQGGIDPAYGIISIPLNIDFVTGVATGMGEEAASLVGITNASLNMQSSLYYDIIAPSQAGDNNVTDVFQEVLLENNLSSSPDASTKMENLFVALKAVSQNTLVNQVGTVAIANADDDMTDKSVQFEEAGFMKVNQMPEYNISYTDASGQEMVIDYNFATGQAELLSPEEQSDASLIGEFRISPDSAMATDGVTWSFDTNIMISLSDLTNGGTYSVDNYSTGGTSREAVANYIQNQPVGELVNESVTISYDSSTQKIAFASFMPPLIINGVTVGPGEDLSGIDLSGIDLSGVDLTGANLTGANLSNVSLVGATLDGVQSGSIVGIPTLDSGYALTSNGYLLGPNVNLSNANLDGVDLTGVLGAIEWSDYTAGKQENGTVSIIRVRSDNPFNISINPNHADETYVVGANTAGDKFLIPVVYPGANPDGSINHSAGDAGIFSPISLTEQEYTSLFNLSGSDDTPNFNGSTGLAVVNAGVTFPDDPAVLLI